MFKRALILFILITSISCTKVYDDDRDVNGPTAPTPVVKADLIEFRVTGNYPTAVIRHSDGINGLTQITTGLPYFASVSSTRDNIFVSLEASAFGSGNLQIQILTNGTIFRESNSNLSFSPFLSVSGTFRRN